MPNSFRFFYSLILFLLPSISAATQVEVRLLPSRISQESAKFLLLELPDGTLTVVPFKELVGKGNYILPKRIRLEPNSNISFRFQVLTETIYTNETTEQTLERTSLRLDAEAFRRNRVFFRHHHPRTGIGVLQVQVPDRLNRVEKEVLICGFDGQFEGIVDGFGCNALQETRVMTLKRTCVDHLVRREAKRAREAIENHVLPKEVENELIQKGLELQPIPTPPPIHEVSIGITPAFAWNQDTLREIGLQRAKISFPEGQQELAAAEIFNSNTNAPLVLSQGFPVRFKNVPLRFRIQFEYEDAEKNQNFLVDIPAGEVTRSILFELVRDQSYSDSLNIQKVLQ